MARLATLVPSLGLHHRPAPTAASTAAATAPVAAQAVAAAATPGAVASAAQPRQLPSRAHEGCSSCADALVVGTLAGIALSRRARRASAASGWASGNSHRGGSIAVRLHAGRRGGKGRGRGKGKKFRDGGVAVVEEQEDELIILPAAGLSLTDLAHKLRKPVAGIITYFFAEKGLALTVNDIIEKALCAEVAEMYEIEVLFDDEEEKKSAAADRGFLADGGEGENAQPRPPVVTVMGHVDHGKTTLLDTIRQRSVAAGEAGGITQRIGAYTVEVGGERATFIDTPGHEAFTAMRARGAQVTDIAVLVVAATDGVMPQTREAIAHAKAAEVPIIVAINKCDMDNANPEQTRQKLSEEGLIAEDWGGEIPMVEVSAKKNINIDSLLEIITLTAAVGELKASYDAPAAGVVLESSVEKSGVLATLLNQRGTLKIGDTLVSGTNVCRVRAMKNEAGGDLKECTPSMAVQVSGFDGPPDAGAQFEVFPGIKEARVAAEKAQKEATRQVQGFQGLSGNEDNVEVMRIALILKTDAQGSIAAVKHMFGYVKDSRYVNLRWVLEAPGPIGESDVELAATCPKDQRAIVVGFNTTVAPGVEKLAKTKGVEIRNFEVIYELFETIVAALQNELSPEEKLIKRGSAEVLAVFNGRNGKVAGSKVIEGMLTVGQKVKVYRKDQSVAEAPIISLRRFTEDVQSVDEDNECGFSLDGWDEWQVGDTISCFEVTIVKPELVSDYKAVKTKDNEGSQQGKGKGQQGGKKKKR